jgi:predicted ATP-grasp superfamily ATP-dependent carboligase
MTQIPQIRQFRAIDLSNLRHLRIDQMLLLKLRLMQIFVYEYLTAVGLGREVGDPLHSMFREGRAMRDAVAADFRILPDVQVVTLDGDNADQEKERFVRSLEGCDWCLVIAPEIGDELHRKASWVRECGIRLLGPEPDAIGLTSNKLHLGQYWQAAGVPTPPALPFSEWLRHPRFPAVVKPILGAGSTATFLLSGPADVEPAIHAVAAGGQTESSLLAQTHVGGRAASVAFLCGPNGNLPLLPAWQHLSDDGRFHYRGGEIPIPPSLARRAVALATQAIGCLTGLAGYVGVDLVLGETVDGSEDFAIEVNPRLTTSYVGLRRLADFNLAGAMLRIATGQEPPQFRWKTGRIRFAPEGD